MNVAGSGNESRSIPDQLFKIFSATLSADKTVRQSAEDALGQLAEQDPHFIIHLLDLACQSPAVCEHSFNTTAAAAGSVLLAGAIRFRNEVGRSDWNRNPRCTDDVKARVREFVVPLQCQPHVSEPVRRQLLAATVEVIGVDYPERWPQLMPQLTSLIEQSLSALRGLYETNTSHTRAMDEDIVRMMLLQLKGCLGVLRGCCKLYEDPLRVGADEADAFASQLLPSLVELVRTLTGRWQAELTALAGNKANISSGTALTAPFRFAGEVEELSHCTRLALKCIFSLFTSRWPACLCDVSALDYFYSSCVVSLIQVFQQVVLPLCQERVQYALYNPHESGVTVDNYSGEHLEDFQQSPVFVLLKWVMKIACKLTQEFATPSSCERRCRAVAKHFAAQYLLSTVEVALELVRWHTAPVPSILFTSKAYIFAIELLTVAVDHKAAYKQVFEPHARELVEMFLLPRLAFTADDHELWNDNPEEYVRKQTSPVGDIYSARVVCCSLLMSLAVGKQKFRSGEILAMLVNVLMNQLQYYISDAAHTVSVDGDPFVEKIAAARCVDAALYCLYQFRRILLDMNYGDERLEYVLMTYAVPVTRYPLGLLRARAVLVLSAYAPSIEWSSPQAYQQALQPVLGLLNDPEAPVRVQACVCFSRLVCHPYARELINPCIAELIQHYFNVMRMMDNEAVVRTLRKTIAFYKNTLSQWALELTEMLVNHFAVVLERVTRKYNAIESMTTAAAAAAVDSNETFLDDDGFADVLLAADELLDTLTTLVKALPESHATQLARRAAAEAAHARDPANSATPPQGDATAASSSSSPSPSSSPALSAEVLQQDIFVQVQLRVAPMLFVVLSHQGGSSYGFMDHALSLLTTLIARSPAIAPPMWKVLWCLHQLIVRGGAVDYIMQLLPPVDNFVSVEPSSFLYHALGELAREPLPASVPAAEAAQTPAHFVFAMCEAVLASDALREREVAAVPSMYDALLHNAWAAAATSAAAAPTAALTQQGLVQYVARQALMTAGTRAEQSPTFRVLLANNVLSCLIVDVPSTLAVLQGLQVTRAFWEQYVMLLSQSVSVDGTDELVLGLLRGHDRTLVVYALVSCLRCLAANALSDPAAVAELTASLEGVVQCGVLGHLAEAEVVANTAELQVHQRRIAKLTGKKSGGHDEDDEADEEEWDSEGDSDDDDGGDDESSDEDDYMDDEDDEDDGAWDSAGAAADEAALGGDNRLQEMVHQVQALRQQRQRRRKSGGGADADDLDDGDVDNLLDDEDFSSPLDCLNAWSALVQEVQRGDGGAGSVVAVLRSAECEAQATAIVQASEVTRALQAARQTHHALLSQSKQ